MAVPDNLKTEIEASKFYLHPEHEHISRKINLPTGYGKDRIVAMIRDPWWIFTYWEITPQTEQETFNKIANNGEQFDRSVLRVHDITYIDYFKTFKSHSYFDITLKDLAKTWYIDVNYPNRSWCVEIGMVTKQGNFYLLARSNAVQTPRFGMSDVLDAKWLISSEKYWEFACLSYGLNMYDEEDLEEFFTRQLNKSMSSPGMEIFKIRKKRKRFVTAWNRSELMEEFLKNRLKKGLFSALISGLASLTFIRKTKSK